MKWKKLGLVFSPDKNIWWQQYYGILPTPIYVAESGIIRIYFASACKEKMSRITFIDVDANDPTIIINNPLEYILDIGDEGTFDDCGVNPSSIIRCEDKYYLYYAGFQRHHRTPYSILSGLAISEDGINFKRYQKTPILERTEHELNIRSAPTVIKEGNLFKMWYVADHGWERMHSPIFNDKLMPLYSLKYAESQNGIVWKSTGKPVIQPINDEFGFGRPYIMITSDKTYRLFYSIRRKSISYRIGFAESNDGLEWRRKDEEMGINISDKGWDSEMVCYPAIISVNNKTFLFYNGNNNGETGFGVAELIEE